MATLVRGTFSVSPEPQGHTRGGGPASGAGGEKTLPGRLSSRGPSPSGSAFPLRLFPQTHGYRTWPSPTQQHSRGGQKERREMSWAQSKEALPLGSDISQAEKSASGNVANPF